MDGWMDGCFMMDVMAYYIIMFRMDGCFMMDVMAYYIIMF